MYDPDHYHDSVRTRLCGGPEPTGWCFCGCGGAVRPDEYFLPGHAEDLLLRIVHGQYGSMPAFARAHLPLAGVAPSKPATGSRCRGCNHAASFHKTDLEKCYVVGCLCEQWVPPEA